MHSTTPALWKAPLTALLLTVVLGACSEDQLRDAATDAAGDAACSVAQQTMDEVVTQTQGALDELGADPAAAERRLTALRDTVRAAESGLSGESRARLEEARVALDDLATLARDEAAGAGADEPAVQQARDDLDAAVTGLTQVC